MRFCLFLLLSCLVNSVTLSAQIDNLLFFDNSKNHHQIFTGIVLNDAPLAGNVKQDEDIRLNPKERGTLQVCTIDRSSQEMIPMDPVTFRIAIFNRESNTIWMFSNKVYQSIQVEEIINKCQSGDRIIIILDDQKYRLPRHEILIMGDC